MQRTYPVGATHWRRRRAGAVGWGLRNGRSGPSQEVWSTVTDHHHHIRLMYDLSARRLKMREWKMRYGQKCKGGKCGSGKCGNRSQGLKMQE